MWALTIAASSTYRVVDTLLTFSGKSLRKSKKNAGLMMEPWGTPTPIGKISDAELAAIASVGVTNVLCSVLQK